MYKKLLLAILITCGISAFSSLEQESKVYDYQSSELVTKPQPSKEYVQWLKDNNERLGEKPKYNPWNKAKVTMIFIVDEEGTVISPKILNGIGEGYDEVAYDLFSRNPHRWISGRLSDGKAVKTTVYYQLDFRKNKNRIVSLNNQPLD